MASLGYSKDLRRWRVRWRAKNRKTDFVFAGSRVFMEKSQATRFYAEIETQERLVRTSEVVPTESIIGVVADYYQHIKKFTSRTQGHYKPVVEKFVASLPKGIVRVHQIESAHIHEYLYRHRGKNRTKNAHLTVIKSFCRYIAERFHIENPAGKVKMLPEDPPHARFLKPEEYEAILKVAWPLARNRLIFLANTGLRASEFAALKPDSISPQATSITIVGKGRKQRTIPLNQSARTVLPKLVPCARKSLHEQCHRIARHANIPPFGPHSLRHYFATQLLLRGQPVKVVSKLLGHKSVATTERCYEHILSDDLANATDVLDD